MNHRWSTTLSLLIALVGLLALTPSASARKPIVSYLDAQETFQLYDAEAGANISPPPPVPVSKEQFRWGMSLNGRYIVFNDDEKKLHLLDRTTNQQIPLPGIDVAKDPNDLTVSDDGLIGFDENRNPPTYVYDSASGQFIDVGLGDADPGKPTNEVRQPRFSGDGNFMVNTCFDDPMTMCETEKDGDSDVYMQNLAAKQQVPEFPDEPAGKGVDEENPCINGDGILIGVERKADKAQTDKDVFLFQRSGNKFTQLETPELNDPANDDRYCQLSSDGAYLSVIQNDVFKLYQRSSNSFVDLPELPFDSRSTLSDPLVVVEPIRKKHAATAKCGGKRATLVGTAKRDRIKGTRKRDVIAGLGGNDVIRGLGGNDIVCGGRGRDRLFGGKGRDLLLGGPGKDVLIGGKGKDKLRGGAGKDRQRQ